MPNKNAEIRTFTIDTEVFAVVTITEPHNLELLFIDRFFPNIV